MGSSAGAPHYRMVQAAQYFVRQAYGDDRIDAMHPLDVERREPRFM